jgi:hypothetical protein
MFSNRFFVGLLAVACIGAAGLGGYIASRQDVTPTPAAAASLPATGAAAIEQPVQETEAVVNEPAPKAAVVTTPKRTAAARNTPAPAARPTTTTARTNTPALERPWPEGSSSPTPASSPSSAPPADTTIAEAPVADHAPAESPRTVEPPAKVLDELVVSTNSVIGLETETRISSETARVEDRVEARVTRDVKVGDAIAIPTGSRAIGSVIQVERGGKFKERARLGIRFTTLVLADGTRLPMNTEAIYREGDSPANSSAAKIGGGAIGGAILGAILGGAKGAAIGATAGAGGGAAAVQVGDRQEVTVPAGSPITVRILSPVTVTVEHQDR